MILLIFVAIFKISDIIKILMTILKNHYPPPIKSLENLPKLEQILKSKNSIFIHIRRGDYTGLSWQLDTSYYKKNAR